MPLRILFSARSPCLAYNGDRCRCKRRAPESGRIRVHPGTDSPGGARTNFEPKRASALGEIAIGESGDGPLPCDGAIRGPGRFAEPWRGPVPRRRSTDDAPRRPTHAGPTRRCGLEVYKDDDPSVSSSASVTFARAPMRQTLELVPASLRGPTG
ncbi:hypothetical protein SLG_14520 [Sphingobium sp. SYK-6]|nr:hypothetical protein SLG_14520 [Sphingobium sp. SYK-6]